MVLLEVEKEHKALGTPQSPDLYSRALVTFRPLLSSTLLVLLVTFGWSSRASLLADTRIHSAAQASAAAHMF